MKIFYILFITCLVFLACNTENNVNKYLNEIDSYIETLPDSALYALKKIEPTALTNKRDRAKHALLMSMALDKNYVDMTDFSVIQPAIDYYKENGSYTDRLRTLYYTGRIYKNIGNNESAMECYVKGIYLNKYPHDTLTMARVFFSKGLINNDIYDYNGFCSDMLQAAHLFEISNRNKSKINALLHAANGYLLLRELNEAMNILNEIEKSIGQKNNMDNSQLSRYYWVYIMISYLNGSKEDVEKYITEYIQNVNEDTINWLDIAIGYYKIGNYAKSVEAIKKYEKRNGIKKVRYHALKSQLYESIGDSDTALKSYKLYLKFSDSIDLVIFKSNTKFVENKFQMEIELQKEKTHKIVSFLIIVILLVSILCIYIYIKHLQNRRKTEKELLGLKYSILESEKSKLEEILQSNNSILQNSRNILLQRLNLLNNFFVANISNKEKREIKAHKEIITLLSERSNFITSNIKVYEISHPQFIEYLKSHNLTLMEIGYCCLYAIGLKIKDAGVYMNTSSHYNINTEIRRKLNICPNSTNLDIYIRNLVDTLTDSHTNPGTHIPRPNETESL
ncbi:MAG: hypothetical protein IKT74_01725 [Bacteroidales bacterium]|nr:hypothetical protein [Bacteroidales bacterium]